MKKNEQTVGVIGLGYIGLPTAALLANNGYKIVGIDVVPSVVETINQGKIHIVEPDLDKMVSTAVQSGKLKATLTPEVCDIFIIAVPTPFYPQKTGEHHPRPNLEYVFSAAESIIPFLKENALVILESTSPVGTTDKIEALYKSKGVDTSKLHFAHCPERVLPGHIIRELVENDRIVGGTTPTATKLAADFYRTFVKGSVLETTAKTAELVKLTENSFRDVNIAFANELSMICDKLQINVWELIQLANRHPRVNILSPGCGVGGHCIAVDPWFVVDAAPNEAQLIKMARTQNLQKTEWTIQQIKNQANDFEERTGRKAKIACLGLAFKPNIDDLRESPALEITERLLHESYNVVAVEPNISTHDLVPLSPLSDAVNSSDIIVVLVGHNQFKELTAVNKIVLDYCGILK